MFSFVFSAVGIFRLVRGSEETAPSTRIAAWLAVIIFVANPNLIYLQSTALTEPLYLVFFIWATVYFGEFVRGAGKDSASNAKLMKCAGCLAAASLTRYDGWFLVVAVHVAVLGVVIKTKAVELRRPVIKFLLLAAVAPALWLAYNAIVYRNPLEFANGPYSAKAIEQQDFAAGKPAPSGNREPADGGELFLKAAELNVAEGNWHRLWLATGFGRGRHPVSCLNGDAGRCYCCGFRSCSMRYRLGMRACRFSCLRGGRSLSTTLATELSCCQPEPFFRRSRY